MEKLSYTATAQTTTRTVVCLERGKGLSTASCHAIVEASSHLLISRQHSMSSSTQSSLPPKNHHHKLLRASSVDIPGAARGLARHKRNSWMQSSVVRRAASVVDEEVAALCEKSPFLNSLTKSNTDTDNNSSDNGNNNNNHASQIAVFHRMEVQLGKQLGKGGFAEVYAVKNLLVDDDDDDQDPITARRRQCQSSVTTVSGRPAYAIKFLRQKLLRQTREFQHAAIDLAVESHYLAALQHPNIVKLRGLTRGGTAAFRTGKHDDFFILMDHLQETLDRRIQRWQQRHSDDDDDEDAEDAEDDAPASQYYHRTLQYAQQIADALTYLHKKSIVYRYVSFARKRWCYLEANSF